MDGWFDSPVESFKASWNDAIGQWQAALAALDAAYSEFLANQEFASEDTDLSPRWLDLADKVAMLQATVDGVGGAIASARNFFTGIGNAVGLSGKRSGLGLLPVIPWALVGLVSAAVAGVYVVVNSLRQFNIDVTNKKIAEQNILNSQQGKPLIPLISVSDSSGGVFSGVSDTAKWITYGVIGYMLLKFLEGNSRGRT
jgi:hypothetical protein